MLEAFFGTLAIDVAQQYGTEPTAILSAVGERLNSTKAEATARDVRCGPTPALAADGSPRAVEEQLHAPLARPLAAR